MLLKAEVGVAQVNETQTVHLDIPARYECIRVLTACISALLEQAEAITDGPTTVYNIELAVHEACTNIVEHAYAGLPGRIKATLTLTAVPRRLVIDLADNGRSFDLPTVPQPNLDEPQLRGYGLFLIFQLMDDVSYTPARGDNHWRLVKNL